ncbi:MAG: hypothetical protein OEX22_10850 [Cyclobacteriaceae bacterium]|nr:hypothetical protein [Cyclobacteriaceae bacterium]
MDIINKTNLLQRALYTLDDAKNETFKPKEDIVTHSVCSKLRDATYDFLSYFLTSHHVDINDNMTISDMRKLCENIDESFKELNFSSIPCFSENHQENKSYCQEVNMVNNCLRDVEKTRDLIFNNSKSKKVTQ